MHYFFGLTVHTTGFKSGLHLVFHCSRSPNFVLLHTQSLSYPFTCISFEQKQKGNKSLTAVVIFFEKKTNKEKMRKPKKYKTVVTLFWKEETNKYFKVLQQLV